MKLLKILLKIAVPISTLWGGIWGDIKLAKFVFAVLPVCEWTGLLRVGVVVVIIALTAGLILGLTMFMIMLIKDL